MWLAGARPAAGQLSAYAHPNHQPSAYRAFFADAQRLPDPLAVEARRRHGLRSPAWGELRLQLAANPAIKPVPTVEGLAVYQFRE